jgi:hypothetical protein
MTVPDFLTFNPRIDSKEPILPGCVAWRAGTTTLFLLCSPPPSDCLKIPAPVMGKNVVWLGEIERKLAKFSMTTFPYRSYINLHFITLQGIYCRIK